MIGLYRSQLDLNYISGTMNGRKWVDGSARKYYLQMLDRVHNQGLRLCLVYASLLERDCTLMHSNLFFIGII